VKSAFGLALFASIVFIVTFILHFPVGLLQSFVQKQIPEPIQLLKLEGRLNQGQALLVVEQLTLRIEWSYAFGDVLGGSLPVRMRFDAGTQGQGSFEFLLRPQRLELVNGTFFIVNPLHHLQHFDAQWAFLSQTTQTLDVNNLKATLPWSNPWPDKLQASGSVRGLNILGVSLNTLDFRLEKAPDDLAADASILLNIHAQELDWELNGNLSLSSDYHYTFNLQLDAKTLKDKPDWAGFFMQNESPTRSRYHSSGRLAL
jgi:hypothetical protein